MSDATKALTVLLIEDDASIRASLTQMLECDGARVIAAENGIQGLAKLEVEKPNLIITDILMPDMDGLEFVMSLVRRGDQTPIIAMSGGGQSITRELSLQSAEAIGVRATLAKPFTSDQLRAAIRHVVG